jgi:transcriptional regulator with GAF, ATPase, and Fis domain
MDEVGELPMSMQAKLLRAVQYNKIHRMGENEERRISCRFVFATHKNLWTMVQEGKFREDLYFRISTVTIEIHALSARSGDIPLISKHISGKLELPQEFFAQLDDYPLPGNVRQLEQLIRRYELFKMLPNDSQELLKKENIQP